jgi:hypothetical protein
VVLSAFLLNAGAAESNYLQSLVGDYIARPKLADPELDVIQRIWENIFRINKRDRSSALFYAKQLQCALLLAEK